MLYLTDGETFRNLKNYVSGGTLYVTYMPGTVDVDDLCCLGGIPGVELKEVFGITTEEIDTLYPGEQEYELCDYCETIHRYGKGHAVYQAFRDCGSLKEQVLSWLIRELGIRSAVDADAPLLRVVTAYSRSDGEHTYVFVENYSDRETFPIKLRGKMRDMRTGAIADTCIIGPYGFGVFKTL